MNDTALSCQEEQRREDVRAAALFGFDYVEVLDDQTHLYVSFLGKAPQKFEKGNLALSGGRRIRDVKICDVQVKRLPDLTLDDYLEVRVNKPGDFSTYTLSAVATDELGQPAGRSMEGFDSRYDHVDFTFKAGCPSDLDCQQQQVCPPPKRDQPEINYLTKDYQSFRQLMLDRLALVMPDWNETHAPDLGITLVELLAYAGDYLSYYQDAVATEAYLDTARERISVRRHARLVDYFMHEGCNARSWVTVEVTDQAFDLELSKVYFITAFPNAPEGQVLSSDDLLSVPASSYEVFEPLSVDGGQIISIYPAHSEIHFYTWGDCQCCLATGATSATLVDPWAPVSAATPAGAPQPGSVATRVQTAENVTARSSPPSSTAVLASDGPTETVRTLKLKAGDILIFEEVKGPRTGNPADADPKHRQAVRLTKVTPAVDPLHHQPIVEIEWDCADALTFPLCISSQMPSPDCSCMEDVSVARGNVLLVDSGGHVEEELGVVPTQSTVEKCSTCCEPSAIEVLPGWYRPVLTHQPLTFSEPLPPPCSAVDFIAQDPRQALPWISLVSIPPGPACSSAAPRPQDPKKGPAAPSSLDAASPQPPCEVKPLFAFPDIDDPTSLAKRLLQSADAAAQSLLARLNSSTRNLLAAWDGTSAISSPLRMALASDLTGLLETWLPKLDLLESGADDRSFVVEIDNDGFGHVRFGNGALGRQPMAGTAFRATYRTGNGRSANTGAETITYIVFKNKLSGVNLAPRNPLPATGGTDPEPISDVKQFAPFALRRLLERAITADDYAALTRDNDRRLTLRSTLEAADPGICASPFRKLQSAKASLRWTGSWYTMLVAVDPAGAEDAPPSLLNEITIYLGPFRRMGHDLQVAPAQYVPLSVALTVCVLPNYLRGHVEAAVLDVLSNRVLPDGRLGFFHPDNLTFGDGVLTSSLLATVQAVPGVQNVELTELERFETGEPSQDVPGEELPAASVLTLGPMEIARLDNDPNFPENGRLILDVRGGR